ncbi:hypothetical protein LIER_12840 [Lithospermum erythrorhizon]|uniref:Uncharacterized protein n=1 Tax=Lithospermum erythrorhizon TaxID=34254 RepID=A0AAV3PXR9_LITER
MELCMLRQPMRSEWFLSNDQIPLIPDIPYANNSKLEHISRSRTDRRLLHVKLGAEPNFVEKKSPSG